MTPEYAQTVAAWLAKAHSDLAAARLLIQGTEPHFDSGVYHCQQAAEKALKGWLTSRQVEFRKTHDLTELLSQCIDIHHSFSVLEESARFLVPFASQFRYPGDLFEPPVEEATRALADASSIVEFVFGSPDPSD
jgi:HEPN domain-containing protein